MITKGQWYVKEPTNVICTTLEGITDIPVATVDTFHPEWEANAAFIVKACNCHDELLEALKDIIKYVPSVFDLTEINNIIAKVEKP
jgi:hypothetical protein